MTPTPPGIRVLIVDDHPTLVWGLERLISSRAPQMQVAGTATSPEEALAQASTHQPDLVLLDLDLDGRSSLDLLPALTQHGLRVLVLTGERNPQVLERAVRLGARGVLRKDAAADQVLRAVEKVHAGELWLDRLSLGRVVDALVAPQMRRCPEALKQASLTPRERRIIQAVLDSQGASNKALAARLFISEHTLRNHLSSIYHKLDVGNRLELYVYAIRHQLGGSPSTPAALQA